LILAQINSVKQPTLDLIEECKTAGIFRESSKTPKSDDVQALAADLESSINTLETYLAYKHHERLAAVKAVPLRSLSQKQFREKSTSFKEVIDTSEIIDEG
jgi:hypothetical protein